MRKNFTLLICLIFVGMSSAIHAQVVTNGNDSGEGSLRQEIIDAGAGGTVTFNGAVTTVTISSGDLDIPYDLTITGPATKVTIDANDTSRIFNITGGTVVLNNLTITDGTAVNGGGVYITNANVRMNNCIVSNNVADGATTSSGGGIYNDVGGVLTVNNSQVSSNSANRAGGGIEDNSGAGLGITLLFVRMVSNTTGSTPGNGGALHITGAGDSNITGAELFNNSASAEGGGFWNGTGTMIIDSSRLLSNRASGNNSDQGGGGIYNNGGNLIVRNNTIINSNAANGTSGSGGGILNNNGTLNVSDSFIRSNTAVRAGGGIEENSVAGQLLTLTNVELSTNQTSGNPGNGGGLHISGAGDSNITASLIRGNLASAEGGGLWNGSGVMAILDSRITLNTASGAAPDQGGGGIYNLSGTLDISSSTISQNVANGASGSGGGILNDAGATLNVSDSEISGNTAMRAGGGIEDNSGAGLGVSLMNVMLNDNSTGSSPGNGGGLHVTGAGDISIADGSVTTNTASSEGGGLWNGSGTMNIDGTTIDANTASGAASDQGGGGIYNLSGTVNITNGATITNNIADGAAGSGGGILNDAGATLNVSDSEISGNTAMRAGGGIEDNSGAGLGVSLMNVMLNDNSTGSSPGNGGGLHVTGAGDTSVVLGTVNNNDASSEGGGLWNGSGTMTVDRVTLDGNTASGDALDNGGGAIYNNGGTLIVTQSTLSNNQVDGTSSAGGGIHNGDGGDVTLLRSTVSGNTSNGPGAGLANRGASFDVNASTIAMNTSGSTGGGIAGVTEVTIKNTVVAYNTGTSGTDVFGTVTSNDYNLVQNDDLNIFAAMANDIEGEDPMLDALADNGGPTMTHANQDKSPTYNGGDPADMFNDQRGLPVFDGPRDIGSFESQVTLSIGDFSKTGISSIYPNPTTGKFYVEVGNSVSSKLRMQIVSMTGQLMADFDMSVGRNEINIDGMSTGIYILNISDGNNKISHKLILQ
ncbi:Por secretion system C-terminal sorting domain-containing protein [Flavobacteriaceae bacterium MAR_2010_188]|nr:Por secretion system C-terminal sorting domain-containing protein [Flavobacteriaceae bacterium MAR_2010_188]